MPYIKFADSTQIPIEDGASLDHIEHQENTHLLLEKLSKPIDQIFDLEKPWVRAEVESHKL